MASFRDTQDFFTRHRRPQAPSERYRVVVIDDDASVRDSLQLLLNAHYDVLLCASARAGVDAVDEKTCAVILDVKMPGEDGFAACNEIRRKVPDIPIIFYSAYQNLKDPYAIINEHRPFGYIVKGGDEVRKLLDVLGTAVRVQAMIVDNRELIKRLEKTIEDLEKAKSCSC
jgi:DNA-binding NtrC family response regulator